MAYIGLFLALLTKHFIVDFLLQGEFEWRNKGTLFHPGGIVHAGKHAFSTLLILAAIPMFLDNGVDLVYYRDGYHSFLVFSFAVIFIELVVHYVIDYSKMNINAAKGWQCNTSPEFWYLTGFDQYLHNLTYVGIVYAIHLEYGHFF